MKILQDSNDKRKILLESTGKFEKLTDLNGETTVLFISQLYKNITREDLVTTLNTLMKMDQNLGGVVE